MLTERSPSGFRRRRRRGGAVLALAVLVAIGGLLALAGDDEKRAGSQASSSATTPIPQEVESASRPDRARLPTVARWQPNADEAYPNAKRLAGRVLQRLSTYNPGTSPAQVAASAARDDAEERLLVEAAKVLVRSSVESTGRIEYTQLGGLTASQASMMVILRQRTRSGRGEATVTRTVDVRLRLKNGGWRLERIASLGGSPIRRPERLPAAARRVLDNPRIELTDSARWDIHRRQIDTALLMTLDRAARTRRFAVAALRSGHPINVFATSRRSAHTDGYAADIWKVDGASVTRQQRPGSPAYALARKLFDAGAYQLGSPWVFTGGGSSFTDAVHDDHLHLQKRRVPGRSGAGETNATALASQSK